jgi:hypothetical protein
MLRELDREKLFIHSFEQTRSQIGMQPIASIDSYAGQALQFLIARHLCVLVS